MESRTDQIRKEEKMIKYRAIIYFRRGFMTFHKGLHYYGTDLKSLWKLAYHIARKYDTSGYLMLFSTFPGKKRIADYSK